MLQSDGEPAWQGKTYNALKDKKHLTGINKEGALGKGMRITPIYPHFNMGHVVEDYRGGGGDVGSKTTWQFRGKE